MHVEVVLEISGASSSQLQKYLCIFQRIPVYKLCALLRRSVSQ